MPHVDVEIISWQTINKQKANHVENYLMENITNQTPKVEPIAWHRIINQRPHAENISKSEATFSQQITNK